jgi:tetratricopeptide (TPR) repeat protein
MDNESRLLARARKRRRWSQENAIVRFEKQGQAMGISIPARSSLRTLLSMFENGRRLVPVAYRPIFRELYRATDEELGFTRSGSQYPLPTPPSLSGGPSEYPPLDILGYLSNVLTEHIKADASLGPRYLVSAVQSQLPLIDRLCQLTRGADRQNVLVIGARFAQFCGWLYQDLGEPESASFWTGRALDYAYELNDPHFIAYTLMRKSNISTESGVPGHGLGLANAALNYSELLTPRLRAVCLRQRANAHAFLSERRDFEEAIEEAIQEATQGVTQDASDLAEYCTPSYIEMEAGMSRALLGQADMAIEAFEHSLSAWLDDRQMRDRGVCLARLAAATASVGNVERACEAGEQALAIAQTTGSARVRAHLVTAYNELSVAKDNLSVREFRMHVAKLQHDGEWKGEPDG